MQVPQGRDTHLYGCHNDFAQKKETTHNKI